MKNLAFLKLAIVILPMQIGAAAAQDIRLATEGAFPPFNFVDDAGEIAGFEREFGDAVCARANLTCTWTLNKWDSMIPNLVAGNFDAILAGMGITDERDKIIDFTEDYVPPAPSSFIVTADAASDCPDGPVAVQTGSIQADYLSEIGVAFAEVATLDEALVQQRAGEVVKVFAGKPALTPLVEVEENRIAFGCKDVILGKGIGIGLRESDTELKLLLNEAIATLKQDGTLAALTEKWLNGGSS